MKVFQEKSPGSLGTVKLIPENPDDLWHASNLITAGDLVTTITSRKVQLTSGKAKNPSRVKFSLELKVSSLDYSGTTLRISGKTVNINEFIGLGSFHTLELEINKEFILVKEDWDVVSKKKLQECRLNAKSYELGVVLIDDKSAYVFLSGKIGTKRCGKIDRKPKSGQEVFFESVLVTFTKHVDLGTVLCVAIAGPNAVKADFRSFLSSRNRKLKNLVLVNTKTGDESSLREVLSEEKVMKFVNNGEVGTKAMEEFNEILLNDSDRACYGLKSVENALALSAIETLLITDELFRSREVDLRKKYTGLVESVKRNKGNAVVISCKRLEDLTGIGAILRFPLPDLDDLVL